MVNIKDEENDKNKQAMDDQTWKSTTAENCPYSFPLYWFHLSICDL